MTRLPRVADLGPSLSGWGYFLCTQKDVRVGRSGGEFLILALQDATGRVAGKIFENVQRLKAEFEAGEFVRIEARSGVFQGRLELAISAIRRVNPDQDRLEGFSEDACVMSAPRSIDEMWAELTAHAAAITDPHVKVLIARLLADHGAAIREWPAAQTIHHAYRGGFLEHVCSMMASARALATVYDANEDLLIAGVILHDIGKLQELGYDGGRTHYTRDGNLVGHIGLGLIMVREIANSIQDFPPDVRSKVEHLVMSHHGTREHGSPVEPKTIEAFILAAVDDLDARINQVRRAIADDTSDEEFTPWHKRFGRVLYKG